MKNWLLRYSSGDGNQDPLQRDKSLFYRGIITLPEVIQNRMLTNNEEFPPDEDCPECEAHDKIWYPLKKSLSPQNYDPDVRDKLRSSEKNWADHLYEKHWN